MLLSHHFDWVVLTIVGCVSGFASGLLGIGGGLVIVPALIFALPHFGVSGAEIPKIAMATSLALIVPTSIASAEAHAARGAVDWQMLGMLAPGVGAGAFLAATLVPEFNTDLVVLLFVTFAAVSSGRLLLPAENGTSRGAAEGKAPDAATLALQGAAGGGAAAILGIGGALFNIPVLLRFIPMQRAIGTASALAVPLAMAGSAGYLLAAAPSGCREGCIGYVFFPAVAAIGIGAVLAAPLGAWLAHRSPVAILRRLFALFLICAAGNLAYKTLYPELRRGGTQRAMAVIEGLLREPAPSASPRRKQVIVHRRRPSRRDLRMAEPPEPAEPEPSFPPLPGEISSPMHLLADRPAGSAHVGILNC